MHVDLVLEVFSFWLICLGLGLLAHRKLYGADQPRKDDDHGPR